MTLPLTDATLDEIEARANAATAGPWERDDPNIQLIAGRDEHGAYDYVCELWFDDHVGSDVRLAGRKLDANATFIFHARIDIPLLTAEVRRLRAELSSARAEMLERAAKVVLAASPYDNRHTIAADVRALPLEPEGEKP